MKAAKRASQIKCFMRFSFFKQALKQPRRFTLQALPNRPALPMGKALAGRTVDIIPPAAAPPWKIGDITMNYHELIQFDSGAEIVRQDSAAPEPTHLLAARLVQKSPEQAALVREHLSRFAKFYGGMSERMDEFVALFPIHPDSIAVLEKIPFVQPPEILRWLSAEVKKLLDAPVPADEPGLISYDRFWKHLRRKPEFQ